MCMSEAVAQEAETGFMGLAPIGSDSAEKPKRKRRTRAEIEAARVVAEDVGAGEVLEPIDWKLVADKVADGIHGFCRVEQVNVNDELGYASAIFTRGSGTNNGRDFDPNDNLRVGVNFAEGETVDEKVDLAIRKLQGMWF